MAIIYVNFNINTNIYKTAFFIQKRKKWKKIFKKSILYDNSVALKYSSGLNHND